MDYKSVTHCTSNEDGEEEVTLEYDQTFFQWLFRLGSTKQVFVRSGELWYHKDTQMGVGVIKDGEIFRAIKLCTSER